MNSKTANENNFLEALTINKKRTTALLKNLLPNGQKDSIEDAMRYTMLNAGKGLRSFLVIESANLFDLPEQQALYSAAAVECIHCYSLVHDDLPAMDDDDIRRGLPTVHKKWDEATAILVGDALQTLAFEILSKVEVHPNPDVRINLINSLAKASGSKGMVGGQNLDIKAEKTGTLLTLNEIEHLQNLKTGALIIWAAQVGPRLSKDDLKPLTRYAKALGLAFQIRDDILDEIGESKQTGKKLRKDANAGKATFVSLLGLEEAKRRSKILVEEAIESLSPYGIKANRLKEAAIFTIERKF